MGERIGHVQQVGPGISSSRIRSSIPVSSAPIRSKSPSRASGSTPRARQVSRSASARSWPIWALIPASANCTGRTPGWRRDWNSGRQQAGGRPPVATASTAAR